VARFGANVVMDILRTHPMVIIGGILQQNPFFVPPDEFLRELRERARDRGLESEVRSQNTEDRGQKSEVRGQKRGP
jgi:hypothetical protein